MKTIPPFLLVVLALCLTTSCDSGALKSLFPASDSTATASDSATNADSYAELDVKPIETDGTAAVECEGINTDGLDPAADELTDDPLSLDPPYARLQMKGEIGKDAYFSFHADDPDLQYYELYSGDTNESRRLEFESFNKHTDELVFKAYLKNGKYIGKFVGKITGKLYEHSYSGVFINENGGKVPFNLQEDGSCWD